jgi:hypothetical protein
MRSTFIGPALVALLCAACSDDDPLASDSGPIDISGTWHYAETTVMVIQPEQDILRLDCVSPEGVLTFVQDGATFTGTLTHSAGSCETPEGVPQPTPWGLPYRADLSGTITGTLLHFDQFDVPPNPPVRCPKHGSVTLAGGSAVELTTTGLCDLSVLPFPAIATNAGVATRQ